MLPRKTLRTIAASVQDVLSTAEPTLARQLAELLGQRLAELHPEVDVPAFVWACTAAIEDAPHHPA